MNINGNEITVGFLAGAALVALVAGVAALLFF